MVTAKFLMPLRRRRCRVALPELSDGPLHQRHPARRRLISPVFVAGANSLVAERRSGLAKPSRSDGAECRPRRGGRELDNRELRKMAKPGSRLPAM